MDTSLYCAGSIHFLILLDFEERNSQVKNFNDGELKSFSMIIIDALGRKSRVETNGEEKN